MKIQKAEIKWWGRTYTHLKKKMILKYEFDSQEELQEAMKDLEKYHDCERCRGKIVCIGMDSLGNSFCAYCGQIVKYPKLSEKGHEDLRRQIEKEFR